MNFSTASFALKERALKASAFFFWALSSASMYLMNFKSLGLSIILAFYGLAPFGEGLAESFFGILKEVEDLGVRRMLSCTPRPCFNRFEYRSEFF